LEKLLKGLVIRATKKNAPFSHDLFYLSKLADLELNIKDKENLEEITKFNIKARYSDFKLQFYKKCTKKYTEKYFKIFNNFYLWLKKFYQKK
jgi:HEPN domain-containing protein